MNKKYFKKIIAQSPKDLEVISALSAGSKVKISDIKYLPKNKIFRFLCCQSLEELGHHCYL